MYTKRKTDKTLNPGDLWVNKKIMNIINAILYYDLKLEHVSYGFS